MKIAVIGAGILGVTTAYELALDGHEVTVFEKCASVAELASFATGGAMAASLTQPFSHPAWPGSGALVQFCKNVRLLAHNDALRPSLLRWLAGWSSNGSDGHFQQKFKAACALAVLSVDRLDTICNDQKIEFERGAGQINLCASEADLDNQMPKLALLKELGVAHKILTADEARTLEPGLSDGANFASAVLFPNDRIGNCRQFSQLLKDRAAQLGARFVFDTAVTNIKPGQRLEIHTSANDSPDHFDRVVVCSGQDYNDLLAGLKIRLPCVAVHGYSLSAPMREPLNGPRNAIFDLRVNVGIARIGSRIRLSTAGKIGELSSRSGKKMQSLLYRTLQTYFPGAAQLSQGTQGTQLWSGQSVMSMDALPVIGQTSVPGVYINTAHGLNGWGMACGSAQLIADQIAGRKCAIEETPFRLDRF
jgi:D-amino-acid dehydrogenase